MRKKNCGSLPGLTLQPYLLNRLGASSFLAGDTHSEQPPEGVGDAGLSAGREDDDGNRDDDDAGSKHLTSLNLAQATRSGREGRGGNSGEFAQILRL